ncbi:MAG: hypothetical protein QOK43_3172 [Acidimicrobiaceae bacterium]|nr:hypothetical protein [Acidimicrobiaceae bacterium]
MTRYAALLRGINLPRYKRVSMAELRTLVEGLGHVDVKTVVQSGNVVFSTGRRGVHALAKELEHAIDSKLGLDVRVLVRSQSDLRKVIEANPMPEAAADPARFHVVFLSASPKAPGLDPAAVAPDEFRFGAGVVYAWYRSGIQESKLAGLLTDKRLGVVATSRNWNTVNKLASA